MNLRIYLDTSVLSAYYDERAVERRQQTEEFRARRNEFEVSTSELAREELTQTLDPTRRARLLTLLDGLTLHPLTDEIRHLAQQYLRVGAFTSLVLNDALHVAAAVLTRQDILLSWNFKHLLNRRRRARINDINISLGLPPWRFSRPPNFRRGSTYALL